MRFLGSSTGTTWGGDPLHQDGPIMTFTHLSCNSTILSGQSFTEKNGWGLYPDCLLPWLFFQRSSLLAPQPHPQEKKKRKRKIGPAALCFCSIITKCYINTDRYRLENVHVARCAGIPHVASNCWVELFFYSVIVCLLTPYLLVLLSPTSGRLLSTPGASNLPRGANKVLDLSTRLSAGSINQSDESRGPLCDL